MSLPLAALDWTSSNIQYLHGSGYLLGSKDRDIVTLEHSNGWQYGQNFMFVDTIHQENAVNDVEWEAYGEAYSYLSGHKLTGVDFSWGPVKDLGFTVGLNAGSQPSPTPFRAYLAGASIQFDLPLFTFLQVDCLAYQNAHLSPTSIQFTAAWELAIPVTSLPITFRGFIDYIGAQGAGPAATVLFQPQLLLDVGDFIGHKHQLMLGMEYQYWHHKFGLPNFDESLPQAVALVYF